MAIVPQLDFAWPMIPVSSHRFTYLPVCQASGTCLEANNFTHKPDESLWHGISAVGIVMVSL
jgi:hypothetical protein